jgi:hypothetical protein
MSSCKFGVFVVLGLVVCSPAMAYVDPVNGAMLLQLLMSGVVGVGLVFRRVISNVFRRVKARLKASSHD